jgi:hypothetical protein
MDEAKIHHLNQVFIVKNIGDGSDSGRPLFGQEESVIQAVKSYSL